MNSMIVRISKKLKTQFAAILILLIYDPLLYSNTIAWYNFDTGTTITDSSENGFDGIIQGINWAEDNTFNIYQNNAKSFNFSGYTTYVSIPNDTAFNCFEGKFTLEFWYKNTGFPSGSIGRIIGKGDAHNSGFDLRIDSDGRLIWTVVYNNRDGGGIIMT